MVSVHHLADYGGPYRGSFVPMLAATATESERRGYATTVWLSDTARDRPWLSELGGVAEIRWLPGGMGTMGSVRPALAAIAPVIRAQQGPGVLHSHFSTFDIPAALMRLRRRQLAVFWHEHSRVVESRVARLRNSARYATLGPLLHEILCVSPEIRQALAERHAPAGRLADFPNAIDTSRFDLITADRRAVARATLGLEHSDRVVLHFGWDWDRKGGDLMLDASDLAGPETVWLTVVGAQGPPAGIADHPRVRVVAPTDDVPSLYAAADVFLSCSRAEGMPYAVLEALASGLPVAGTDLVGQVPLLEGLPGTEIVTAAAPQIAAAVDRLLALDETARGAQATAARRRVVERYALDAWAKRLVDRYAAAISGWVEPPH